MKISKVQFTLMSLSISLFSLVATSCKPKETRPNIVMILVDDMGYGDLKSYNPASKIETPHIDKLASQGVRFTDAHSTASVCKPSRYSLLTGQAHYNSNRNYEDGMIAPDRPTVASVLQGAGYKTAAFGKWHLGIVNEKTPKTDTDLIGGPLDHGFDYFHGIPASLDIPPYYFIENRRAVQLPSGHIEKSPGTGIRNIEGKFYRDGGIAPDYQHEKVLEQITANSAAYLKKQASSDEPFFMYLALPAPHTPWLPSKEFQGKSGAGMYGDYVMQVDAMVGQVMDALKESGNEENTVVFFSSDNGPVWWDDATKKYNHDAVAGLAGMKGDAWEGGHRLPFIVKWPTVIGEGLVNDNLICFTDFFATASEIAEAEAPLKGGEDSQSFVSLLKDNDHAAIRNSMVQQSARIFSYRKGKWKYINGKGPGGFTKGYDPSTMERDSFPAQLYNLEADIGESNNLYEENNDIALELEKELNSIIVNLK